MLGTASVVSPSEYDDDHVGELWHSPVRRKSDVLPRKSSPSKTSSNKYGISLNCLLRRLRYADFEHCKDAKLFNVFIPSFPQGCECYRQLGILFMVSENEEVLIFGYQVGFVGDLVGFCIGDEIMSVNGHTKVVGQDLVDDFIDAWSKIRKVGNHPAMNVTIKWRFEMKIQNATILDTFPG